MNKDTTRKTPGVSALKNQPNPRPPRAGSRQFSALASLIPFFHPYKGLLALTVVVLLSTTLLSLALPLVIRHLIDTWGTDISLIQNRYFVAAFAAASFIAGGNALRFLLIARLGEKVVVDIRKAVFDRVICLSPSFYEKIMTGEIVSRISTDTMLIQSLIGLAVLTALRNVVILFGGLFFLFLTSVKLTLILLLVVPLILLPVVILGRKLKVVSREAQKYIALSSANATESLSAVQTVQSFTHEVPSQEQFALFTGLAFDASQRRILYRAMLMFTVSFLTAGLVVGVLWVGVQDVRLGQMTFGALVQFVIYSGMLAGIASGMASLWGDLQRAAGATERLIELLQLKDTLSDPKEPKAIPAPVQGRIAFENVRFSYPSRPKDAALNGVSFTIEPGETIAFVGPSGAGKTTIIQLIQRFYDPIEGRITLDGYDLCDLERQAFRRAIAIVAQDPMIFAASALDNISFGSPAASEKDIELAAGAAAAHDFISELPDGYASYLGERGIMLSGGQKQRVAIARAVLRDAPVLLLDEATSSLDAESEHAVQNAIDLLSRNRTTLIVAHRLATVKKADRIIVLDEGQVVAIGGHDELVAQGGLYARLARLQFTDGKV